MSMKKHSILVLLLAAFAFTGCVIVDHGCDMDGFTGTEVAIGEENGAATAGLKLLVLNEGAWPGNSTLDILDIYHKKYYSDIFGQANPDVAQGIGNGGNDIEIAGNHIWLAMNASNQLVGLNPSTYKMEVQIELDSPRCMVSDDTYLYISSYGSAVYGGNLMAGKVFRINLKDYSFTSVGVGYQPEGMVIIDGKLYVANSGGYNEEKDNRIDVIDLESFTVEKVLELPVSNLNMMRKVHDEIWVSTYATYDASFAITAPSSLAVVAKDGTATVINGVHADKITESDGWIYAIGNNAEMSFGSDYCLYKINSTTKQATTIHFKGTELEKIAYPYCILVNPFTSDIIIADASFTGDSKLYCFDSGLNYRWSITTGVGTGHLLLYQL